MRGPAKSRVRHRYGEIHRRTLALAAARQSPGLQERDRVATLRWRHHEHRDCDFGIQAAAAGVMHTLHPRLSPNGDSARSG